MSTQLEHPLIPVMSQRFGSWHFSLNRRALGGDELSQQYDIASSGWDRTLERLSYPAAYESLLSRALSSAANTGSSGPMKVLDCGSGSGALSEALLRIVRRPVFLDALDSSEKMLDVAASRLAETNCRATFTQGDAQSLPYPSNYFDVAMAAHLIEHLDDPLVALRELYRVTKPGGLVVIFCTRRSAAGFLIHLKWRTHLISADMLERFMQRSGLQNVIRMTPPPVSAFSRLSNACFGSKPVLDARGHK